MKKGFFITVEGIEGAGKSTLIQHIKNDLTLRRYSCITTREPGGSPIAEDIRHLLLASVHDEKWTAQAELLLMYAARAQHLSTVIIPHLSNGTIVLCDRFCDASYAYQVSGRGAPLELFNALEESITRPHYPDLTILLDIDPDVGMLRVEARAGQLDRIEKEKVHFFKRVRAGYLQRAVQYPHRISVVNAAQPQGEVMAEVRVILSDFLEKKAKAHD